MAKLSVQINRYTDKSRKAVQQMNSFFQLSNVQFMLDAFLSSISGIKEFALIYAVCILGLFIIGKKFLTAAFVWPLVFMCLTIFNPFLMVPLAERINLTLRIRRIFWLIPINLVLAYVFTSICMIAPRKSYLTDPPKSTARQKRANYTRRAAVFTCIVLSVVLLGNAVIPHMQLSGSIYKVDSAIPELAAVLDEDSRKTGLDKIVLYSDVSLLELREYDPSIGGALERYELLSYSPKISDESATEKTISKAIQSHAWLYLMALVSRFHLEVDTNAFQQACQEYGVNYIIMCSSDGMGEYYVEAGCSLIASVGDYEVYRFNWE